VKVRAQATLLGLILLPTRAWAIPAYARFFKEKYGRQAHCMACHRVRDNWELNGFGKDFARKGRTLAGLEAVEWTDSDGDLILNLKEIEALANPGDPYSRPGEAGEYLRDPHVATPDGPLRKAFPSSEKPEVLFPQWSQDQKTSLEGKLSASKGPLPDEALYPVVFLVKDAERKPFGSALYVSYDVPREEPSASVFLLIADREARVAEIIFRIVRGDRRIKRAKYLDGFIGLGLEEMNNPPAAPAGAEEEAGLFLAALRRGLSVLAEAAGTKGTPNP